MNILLINYEYPPIGGGAGNATYNYAREFVKLGHDVVVITSAFGCIYEYKNENGVHLYRIPALRKHKEKSNPVQMMSYVFSTLLFSYGIIKRHKISHSIAFMSIPSGIVGLIHKLLYKIPYIVSLRGADVPNFEKQIGSIHKAVTPLRRFILSKASFIVSVSENLGKLSMQTDPFAVKTIRTGVDTFFFKPKLTNENDKINFIFTGRFAPQKNLEYIIKQFSLICEEYPNTFLTLVGDGPIKYNISKMIKNKKIEDRVIIKKWMSKTELVQEYQKADCFVSASLTEGLSNSNLEAMASGLAIIASDVTGNNDLIRHEENGLLFSLQEDNGLYKTLKRLVDDKNLLNYLKVKSREEACEYYAWEMSARKYIELLRNWA